MDENVNKLDLGLFVNSHDKLWDYCFKLHQLEQILTNDQFRYFYLVSLISSDNIIDIESAQTSLDQLNFIKDNIFYLNLSDDIHKETMQYVNKGIRIVKRDLKEFRKHEKCN